MLLKNFITNSLIEIYEGIKEARTHTGNVIAPKYAIRGGKNSEKDIHFKIYVSVEETASNEVSGNISAGLIKVLSGKVDGKQSDSSNNSYYQELTFSVPYNPDYYSITPS